MELIKKESNLLPNLPRFFDDFLNNELFDWGFKNFSSTGTSLPAVNILETSEAFVVEMAAPGMKKSDFKIELKDNVLVISSERRHEPESDDAGSWLRREFSYQSFQRAFTFNKNLVEDGRIQAAYQDGMLKLILPKKEEVKAKPARTIQVN